MRKKVQDVVDDLGVNCTKIMTAERYYTEIFSGMTADEAIPLLNDFIQFLITETVNFATRLDEIYVQCDNLVIQAGKYMSDNNVTCVSASNYEASTCEANLNDRMCEIQALFGIFGPKKVEAVNATDAMYAALGEIQKLIADAQPSIDNRTIIKEAINELIRLVNEEHWKGHWGWINLMYTCDCVNNEVNKYLTKYLP